MFRGFKGSSHGIRHLFYVDDNLFDDKLRATSQMFGVFRIDRKFRTCK